MARTDGRELIFLDFSKAFNKLSQAFIVTGVADKLLNTISAEA